MKRESRNKISKSNMWALFGPCLKGTNCKESQGEIREIKYELSVCSHEGVVSDVGVTAVLWLCENDTSSCTRDAS